MAKVRDADARLLGAALAGAAVVSLVWALDVVRRSRRHEGLHRHMVELLMRALSAGDQATARHSRRVADLSYALAEACGMGRHELGTLRVAALLHDMGKIDDRFFDIVHSRRPLSPAQRVEIKNHPHESAHILAPLEPHHPGIHAIVSSHHECWDGTGYPFGLAGDEIPLGARIISLADAFDAMTQPRKYRDALPVDRALDELREASGTQFDPALVDLAQTPEVRDRWSVIAEREIFGERDPDGEPDGADAGRPAAAGTAG